MAGTPGPVRIRLFGPARTAFGTALAEAPAGSVAEVVAALLREGTPEQAAVVATCGRWVNGEPAADETPLRGGDELALLPPVSGGCGGTP